MVRKRLFFILAAGILIALFAWHKRDWPVVTYSDSLAVPEVGPFLQGLNSDGEPIRCLIAAPWGAHGHTILITGRTVLTRFVVWSRAAGLEVDEGDAGGRAAPRERGDIRRFTESCEIEASFSNDDATAFGTIGRRFRVEAYCRRMDGVYTLMISVRNKKGGGRKGDIPQ